MRAETPERHRGLVRQPHAFAKTQTTRIPISRFPPRVVVRSPEPLAEPLGARLDRRGEVSRGVFGSLERRVFGSIERHRARRRRRDASRATPQPKRAVRGEPRDERVAARVRREQRRETVRRRHVQMSTRGVDRGRGTQGGRLQTRRLGGGGFGASGFPLFLFLILVLVFLRFLRLFERPRLVRSVPRPFLDVRARVRERGGGRRDETLVAPRFRFRRRGPRAEFGERLHRGDDGDRRPNRAGLVERSSARVHTFRREARVARRRRSLGGRHGRRSRSRG